MLVKIKSRKWTLLGCALLFFIVGTIYLVLMPRVYITRASYAFDVSDERRLANFCDNVFTGQVIAQVSSNKDLIPETQYKVLVKENLKGNLTGEVIVNQLSGYGDDGNLYLYDGDKLLEPDQLYLFAGRYDEKNGYYTVVPNYGDLPLQVDQEQKSGPKENVNYDAKSKRVIEDMKFGIKNQIPYDQKTYNKK